MVCRSVALVPAGSTCHHMPTLEDDLKIPNEFVDWARSKRVLMATGRWRQRDGRRVPNAYVQPYHLLKLISDAWRTSHVREYCCKMLQTHANRNQMLIQYTETCIFVCIHPFIHLHPSSVAHTYIYIYTTIHAHASFASICLCNYS